MHAGCFCGDLSHHDGAHLCPDLQQGRASCYRELCKGFALHDAAVDYLCSMPYFPLAQVGICEVAYCWRADLYDPCRDCQHCYETSGAGIINHNEDNTMYNSREVSPYNCIDIAHQYYYLYKINSTNRRIIIQLLGGIIYVVRTK